MDVIIRYNKAIIEIESPFTSIPYAQALLVKLLITRADPATGIVNCISYNELAKLLTINPAPGRKESGTPTKQTIRNYIKSIERECGDYFKVISEGQSLKFLFSEMPKIFSQLFDNRKVNTVVNSRNALEKTGGNDFLKGEANTELNTEANTPNDAVKKFIYINKTKQTKQNNSNTAVIFSTKKSIADDFYPDAETIEIALSKGYSNVIEPEEIKAFIKHNTTHQTQWADFNPVFLCWLERNAEYQAQQKHQGTANHMECIDEPSDSDIFFGIHETVMAPPRRLCNKYK